MATLNQLYNKEQKKISEIPRKSIHSKGKIADGRCLKKKKNKASLLN